MVHSKRRIISLVPSLTETVAAMGLEEDLVGVTKFCVEPKGIWRKANLIGGTKDPDLQKMKDLRPTHILVNEEENKPEHIAECESLAPTLRTFPKKPQEVPAMLRSVEEFLGAIQPGLAGSVEESLEEFSSSSFQSKNKKSGVRYLYFIWQNPYMVAGADSYISGMLDLMGARNVAPSTETRYPELSLEDAAAANPQVLLLSSEPFPFRSRDAAKIKEQWPGRDLPDILHIDGRLMSWYGVATIEALEKIKSWARNDAQDLVRPFHS
jgi:iron complex transport system substrate-binding protein